MVVPTYIKQKLRQVLALILSITLALPPQPVLAHYVDHIIGEETLYQRTIFRSEQAPQNIDCHDLQRAEDGAFIVTLHPDLKKQDRHIYLLHNEEHMATLQYAQGIFHLIGCEGYDFVLDGRQGFSPALKTASVFGDATFYEHPIAPDGNCGFRCLGVDREEMIERLIRDSREKPDPTLMHLVAGEIKAAFLQQKLPWWEKSLSQMHQRQCGEEASYQNFLHLKSTYTQSSTYDDRALDDYCHRPAVFRDFLHFEYGYASTSSGWLSFQPGLGEHHTNWVFDVIAAKLGKNFKIWERENSDDLSSHLILKHHHRHSETAPEVNLIYTSTIKGGEKNHYNLLQAVAGQQDYPPLFVQTQGNVTVRGGMFNGHTIIHSKSLSLQDSPWFSSLLETSTREKVTIDGALYLNQAHIKADDLDIQNGSQIRGITFSAQTKTGTNKGEVLVNHLSLTDFQQFYNEGRLKGLYTHHVKGQKFCGVKGSELFAGLLQEFDVHDYNANGHDYSALFSQYSLGTASFGRDYQFFGTSLRMLGKGDLLANSGAKFFTTAGAQYTSSGQLVFNGEASSFFSSYSAFPFHKFRGTSSQTQRPLLRESEYQSYMNSKLATHPLYTQVLKERPNFNNNLEFFGQFGLRIGGKVYTSQSVVYSSSGKFQHYGETHTRGNKDSRILMQAQDGIVSRLLESSGLITFRMKNQLSVLADVRSAEVTWQSGKGDLKGSIRTKLFKAQTADDFTQSSKSTLNAIGSTISSGSTITIAGECMGGQSHIQGLNVDLKETAHVDMQQSLNIIGKLKVTSDGETRVSNGNVLVSAPLIETRENSKTDAQKGTITLHATQQEHAGHMEAQKLHAIGEIIKTLETSQTRTTEETIFQAQERHLGGHHKAGTTMPIIPLSSGTNAGDHKNEVIISGQLEAGQSIPIKAEKVDTLPESQIKTSTLTVEAKKQEHAGHMEAQNLHAIGEIIKTLETSQTHTTEETIFQAQERHLGGRHKAGTTMPIIPLSSGTNAGDHKNEVIISGQLEAGQSIPIKAEKVDTLPESQIKTPTLIVEAKTQKFEGDAVVKALQNKGHSLEFTATSTTRAEQVTAKANTIELSGVLQAIKTAYLEAKDKVQLHGQTRGGDLAVVSRVIENAGDNRTKNLHLEASKEYIDTETTINEASENLTLLTPNNKNIKGKQKAGRKATVQVEMDFFDLLDLIDAPSIVMDIGKTDVDFTIDFFLAPHLSLFAGNLTNSARLMTAGDFKSSLHGRLDSQGSMFIGGDGQFKTQEGIMTYDVTARGTLDFETAKIFDIKGMLEGKSVSVLGAGVNCEREVRRTAIYGGYRDVLGRPVGVLAREGDVRVEGKQWLHARGAEFRAKGGHLWMAAPDFYVGSQILEEEATWSTKKHYHHHYYLTHHKSILIGDNGIDLVAKVAEPNPDITPVMILEGVDTSSSQGAFHNHSDGQLHNSEVHDHSEQTDIRKKKRNLRGKKTVTVRSAANTARPNSTKALKEVTYDSVGANHQHAPIIESGDFVRIKSLLDKVFMHAVVSFSSRSTEKKSKSAAWFSNRGSGYSRETATIAQISAENGIEIDGFEGINVDVVGKYLQQAIKRHLQRPETEWIKSLQGRSDVDWNLIQEKYESWKYKTQGMPPAASTLLALTVAAALSWTGVGASLAGALSSGLSGTAIHATVQLGLQGAITSVASQATVSLISNQGNIGRTLKDLGSKEALRSMAIAAFTSGNNGGVQPTNLLGHIQDSATRALNTTIATTVIGGEHLTDVAKLAVRSFVANSFSGWVAQNIGEVRLAGLDFFTHKVAHFLNGAVMAGILSNGDVKSMLTGGAGAALAETIGELLLPDLEVNPTPEQRQAYREQIQRVADIARLGTGVAALATGRDIDLAVTTADTALRNNLLTHAEEQAAFNHQMDKGAEKIRENYERFLRSYQEYSEASATLDQFMGQLYDGVCDLPADAPVPHWQRELFRVGLAPDCFEVFDPALRPMEAKFAITRQDTRVLFAVPMIILGGVRSGDLMMSVARGYIKEKRATLKTSKTVQGMDLAESKPTNSRELFLNGGQKGKITQGLTKGLQTQTCNQTPKMITAQGIPNAGGVIRSFVTRQEEVYYRVYSGNTTVGRFLTKVPPKNSALVQQGLSLPPSNTAEFIQEVIVPAGTRLQRSRALHVPEWGKRGGMEQFQILEKDITKIIFKDGEPFK